MKKTLLAGLAIGLLMAGTAGMASALIVTDTTLFTATGTIDVSDYVAHKRGDVNFLTTNALQLLNPDNVIWNHQFTFVPPASSINSGKLTLWLRDDQGEGDGGLLGWKNEYALGVAEGGQWAFGEVDTQAYPNALTNLSVLNDGVFQVTLWSTYGDFYIDKSELVIDYNPVPEPTTMLLMGTGLAGLIAARRRKANKN